MSNLAQAYIHLKPYSASERKIQSLGRYTKRVAMKAAADIYGGGVEVEVEIEEGSLITRVTVIGSVLLGAYSTVADYKGFKESVIELCDDAREFATDVCGPFVKKAGVPKEDIYRFERRLKSPGKLYRLSKRLEKLEHSLNELSPRDVQRELAGLRAQLDSIAKDLSSTERNAIEAALRRPKLPAPNKWPMPEQPKVAIQRDDELEQPALFGDGSPEVEASDKRRVVFKEVASVPRATRKPRKKRQISPRSDLLSSPTGD